MKRTIAAVALAFGLTAPGVVLAGCGVGEDEYTPPKPPQNVGYPYDEARLGADGLPEKPTLYRGQKEEALFVAQHDPLVVELLKGHPAEWRDNVAIWTRGNQELLGAAFTVRFDRPVDFQDATWPIIENAEELYGEQGPEGVVTSELQPGVDPVIGTKTASENGVRSLLIMVDLERGQVANVLPMTS